MARTWLANWRVDNTKICNTLRGGWKNQNIEMDSRK